MKIQQIEEFARALHITPDPVETLVTEVIHFDYSALSHAYRAKDHLHHYHQLDVVLDGEFTLLLENDVPQVGRRGDAWVIPPLIWHGVDCANPFRYCSFKFHLAPRFWPIFGTAFQRFRLPEYLVDGVEAVAKRSAEGAPLSGQNAAAAITSCLIALSDQHAPDANINGIPSDFCHFLWPLLESIEREPSIKWNVSRLAAMLHLSPDHFSRCFRDVVGQSPQRYVLETAMRAAAAGLLKDPPLPIKEIAGHAGYANVQAFTHAFTRIFKISPATYRDQSLL